MESFRCITVVFLSFAVFTRTLQAAPVKCVPNGNCQFSPENENDLREATRRLSEIISALIFVNIDVPGDDPRNSGVLPAFELLQAHTPFPLMKYACAAELPWAICNESYASRTSRIRTPDKRAPSAAVQTQESSELTSSNSLIDLYLSSRGKDDHQAQCELSHLRPHCVFNPKIFPPVICQAKCSTSTLRIDQACAEAVARNPLVVMEIERCGTGGEPVWKKKTIPVLPLENGVCRLQAV